MYVRMFGNRFLKGRFYMSQKNLKTLHLVYSLVLSALALALATVLVVMCIDIYNSGPHPFTRESVGERLLKISPLIYIFIAAVICGVVLNTVAPVEKERAKGTVPNALVLRRLYGKMGTMTKETSDKIEKQRAIRFIMIVVSFILILGASIASLIYVLSVLEPSADMHGATISASLGTLRFFIAPLSYLIVTVFVCKSSVKKELDAVKEQIKLKNEGEERDEARGAVTKLTDELYESLKSAKEPKVWHKYFSFAFKCALACTAIVFIFVGIDNGGMADVLGKAVKICTECIGMG